MAAQKIWAFGQALLMEWSDLKNKTQVLDLSILLLLALWAVLKVLNILQFPFEIIILAPLFFVSLGNAFCSTTRKNCIPYEFGYHASWHPYCTLILSISAGLFSLSDQFQTLNILYPIAWVLILIVILWSHIYWWVSYLSKK